MAKRIDLKDVNIYYGSFHAVADVSLAVPPRSVTAFIGPSGCGKSTVLRALNRMHEVIPGARVEGKISLDGEDIYSPGVDPVNVRRTIGMVFQRPNPFPKSIYDNVAQPYLPDLDLDGMGGRLSAAAQAQAESRADNLLRSNIDKVVLGNIYGLSGQRAIDAINNPNGLAALQGAVQAIQGPGASINNGVGAIGESSVADGAANPVGSPTGDVGGGPSVQNLGGPAQGDISGGVANPLGQAAGDVGGGPSTQNLMPPAGGDISGGNSTNNTLDPASGSLDVTGTSAQGPPPVGSVDGGPSTQNQTAEATGYIHTAYNPPVRDAVGNIYEKPGESAANAIGKPESATDASPSLSNGTRRAPVQSFETSPSEDNGDRVPPSGDIGGGRSTTNEDDPEDPPDPTNIYRS